MSKRYSVLPILGLSLLLAGGLPAQEQQKPDEIPDAPSATRPIPPPPAPSPRPGADQDNPPDTAPPDATGDSVTSGSKELPHSNTEAPIESTNPTPAPPMPPIKTVPAGSVPKDVDSGQDVGYTLKVTANLVLVPVTVKDSDGRMVNGLSPKDFIVLENGQRQTLKFFTSDPFSLSAAVVFDLGMPDIGVKLVQDTLPALQGAFSPYDEVAIYTYSSTVTQIEDFGSVGQRLTFAMNEIKTYRGDPNGVPVTGGPLGPQGPMINGLPIDNPVTPVSTPPKESRVINDAILKAARDLSKRDRTRRKVIFVISDGRERGSTASFKDTLKVLQTQGITVYAIGVDGASIPGYNRLQKIHLPSMGIGKLGFEPIGYGNILSKYVGATGGGTVYSESARNGVEQAYMRAMGDARNQYTLGYASKGIGGYRDIVVRVRRPEVKVYAKDGYYPLPTPR